MGQLCIETNGATTHMQTNHIHYCRSAVLKLFCARTPMLLKKITDNLCEILLIWAVL